MLTYERNGTAHDWRRCSCLNNRCILSCQAASLQYRHRVGSSANQSPTSPVSNQGFSPGGSPQVRTCEPTSPGLALCWHHRLFHRGSVVVFGAWGCCPAHPPPHISSSLTTRFCWYCRSGQHIFISIRSHIESKSPYLTQSLSHFNAYLSLLVMSKYANLSHIRFHIPCRTPLKLKSLLMSWRPSQMTCFYSVNAGNSFPLFSICTIPWIFTLGKDEERQILFKLFSISCPDLACSVVKPSVSSLCSVLAVFWCESTLCTFSGACIATQFFAAAWSCSCLSDACLLWLCNTTKYEWAGRWLYLSHTSSVSLSLSLLIYKANWHLNAQCIESIR